MPQKKFDNGKEPSGPGNEHRADGLSTSIGGNEPVEVRTAEPLTLSLMGKLFGIPLLIIGSIVAGAVLVVVLFGGPSSPPQRSIESLLQALESGSGERSMGVLLPQEKELWQTALELAKRLEKKEVEVTPEELQAVATRLGALVTTELGNLERLPTLGAERVNQQSIRSRRLEFLIHALGRTEREEALGPLLSVVRARREPYAATAMKQIAELKSLPGAAAALEPMLVILNSPSSNMESRLVACTALSVLADTGDATVIAGLSEARLANQGELAWASALALARLGSPAGKITLMDVLDRSFWETGERYEVTDSAGAVHRYRMPGGRIESLLVAGIEAASHLNESDLWEMIERLKSDDSAAVRAAATKAVEGRQTRQAAAGGTRKE